MKIIKHGNTYKKTKCDWCNCEFEYTDNDITQEFMPVPYTPALKLCGIVNCPECNTKQIIEYGI